MDTRKILSGGQPSPPITIQANTLSFIHSLCPLLQNSLRPEGEALLIWVDVAEEAYIQRVKLDKVIALLQSAAVGERDPSSLEEGLAAFHPKAPAMPETSAVLACIPASESHPGAIYRLAGDRQTIPPPSPPPL